MNQAGLIGNLTANNPSPGTGLRAAGVVLRSFTLLPVLVLGLVLAATNVCAQPPPLSLLVQPQSWRAPGHGAAKLARYLQQSTGLLIQSRRSEDSLSHWRTLRGKRGFELVLDEAQFTDYLIQWRHYMVLVQSSRPMRFELAVRPGTVFTDPAELTAQRIAVAAPPSLAALRLLELFPGPTHFPTMVQFNNLSAALRALQLGQVKAIVLPVTKEKKRRRIETKLVTDASPGLGFSASPGVSLEQRRALTRALLNAHRNPVGLAALKALRIPAFELSSASAYEGSASLLHGTWGYSSTD